MHHPTQEQTTRFIVGIASVIISVLGSNSVVDYRSEERVANVSQEVGSLAEQNHEILKGIQLLLDEKLSHTEASGEKNTQLNQQIIDLANKRMERHKKEVVLLQQLQDQIDKIKSKGK